MTRVHLGSVLAVVGVLGCWSAQSATDFEAAQLCRAQYQRARTKADSTAVDAQRPVLTRGSAPRALTCGAMRASGWTNPPSTR